MGQTLSHGVYLPAEGERNCYPGLASNWNLLDTTIGDIAGKASASHTHGNITNDGKVGTTANLPLITGTGGAITAGAFGNQANTFCEGNDSRLSDARTPVAHTHTKSDVTDLFNSANVWSNANTFTRNADDSFLLFKNTNINALVPTDTNYHFADLNFYDVSSKIISKIRSSGTGTKIVTELTARSWSADGTTNEEVKLDLISDIQNSDKKTTINSNFIPSANNSYDLGTSTAKWKTLNGINPGALSLPSNSYTGPIAITEIDRTGWVYDGTANSYSPPVDCWLSISNGGSITVWGTNTAFGMKAADNIAIPLRQGETYNVSLTHTPDFCRIYPCNGNV